MIGLGYRYNEEEELVTVNSYYLTQIKSVVKYPYRPLLCLTLMIAGIVLILLLLLSLFAVPPTFILY